MLGRRRLQRRCHSLIDRLERHGDIPDPWDFDEFCARLEGYTGRRLRVMPPLAAMSGAPCGLYVSAGGTDYIYTTAGTTAWHRQHIALHEIGHLLSGHDGGLGVGDLAQILLPDLDPALVRTVLGRTSYSNAMEREAESFATQLAARAGRDHSPRPHPAELPDDPVVAGVITRLEHVLGPVDPHRAIDPTCKANPRR